jgi:hypothetical protein
MEDIWRAEPHALTPSGSLQAIAVDEIVFSAAKYANSRNDLRTSRQRKHVFLWLLPLRKDGEVRMRNLIGGLFETQENANRVYQALENSGFAEEQIHMFVRKPRASTARKMDVQIQDIAKYAILGGFIIGALGGLLGFLVGIGVIPLPYLEPGAVERNGLFISMSVTWGLAAGGLTGIILGVAWKLLKSREKAEVTTRQIEKRGVLVAVSVDNSQTEKKVRRVMEENKALEVGNPSEKWDLEGWSSPNDNQPSLKNLANTR